MVGNARCNGGSSSQPAALLIRKPEFDTQTVMISAKIVDCSDQIDTRVQGGNLLHYTAAAPYQRSQARAKGRIEPLNVRGVDAPLTLRSLNQRIHLCRGALTDAFHDAHHTPATILLDHLRDVDAIPGAQTWTPRLTRWDWFPKGVANSFDIGAETIDAKQQGATQSTCPHLLYQRLDQSLIAALAHHTAQPQARLNLNGHR